MNESCEWLHRVDWEMDWEDENVWHTSCGQEFQLHTGTPKENSFRYCCYCGKELVEKVSVSKYEDEEV